MDDDEVDVSLRLDDTTTLKLAMIAHEAGMTLNDAVVAIIALTVDDWRRQRPGSRNQREGTYVGRYNGLHIRSSDPHFQVGRLDRCIARAVRRHRLKLRVARYQAGGAA